MPFVARIDCPTSADSVIEAAAASAIVDEEGDTFYDAEEELCRFVLL